MMQPIIDNIRFFFNYLTYGVLALKILHIQNCIFQFDPIPPHILTNLRRTREIFWIHSVYLLIA